MKLDTYENPSPGKTYISPSLPAFGQKDRTVRIASKVIEAPTTYAFAKIKDELVLRHRNDGKSHIKAVFYEDDRRIRSLNIQGFSIATERPHNASFSFVGDEIEKLLEFLVNIQLVTLKSKASVNITDNELRRIRLSNLQARSLVEENEELFAEVVRLSLTKRDVVAIGYRKKQLDVFHLLLEDPAYFEDLKRRKGCTDEKLWQQFFEKNPWIFGYGLSYLYLDSLDDKKLEQVVQGHSVAARGKRVDALMKTRGVISSLCFVEIKTHTMPLLAASAYRAGCWAAHSELSGAIAQVQGSVASAMDSLRGKLSLNNSEGDPTGEEAFNYAPKAFLVVGNLESLVGEHGVNAEKFRSFELLRRNTFQPEIITFDELYERARFIVHQNGG
jgi:hypothetical protein